MDSLSITLGLVLSLSIIVIALRVFEYWHLFAGTPPEEEQPYTLEVLVPDQVVVAKPKTEIGAEFMSDGLRAVMSDLSKTYNIKSGFPVDPHDDRVILFIEPK